MPLRLLLLPLLVLPLLLLPLLLLPLLLLGRHEHGHRAARVRRSATGLPGLDLAGLANAAGQVGDDDHRAHAHVQIAAVRAFLLG